MTQGGLEIRCQVTAYWVNEEWLGVLKKHIDENYRVRDNEKDDSNAILKDMKVEENDPDSGSESEVEMQED